MNACMRLIDRHAEKSRASKPLAATRLTDLGFGPHKTHHHHTAASSRQPHPSDCHHVGRDQNVRAPAREALRHQGAFLRRSLRFLVAVGYRNSIGGPAEPVRPALLLLLLLIHLPAYKPNRTASYTPKFTTHHRRCPTFGPRRRSSRPGAACGSRSPRPRRSSVRGERERKEHKQERDTGRVPCRCRIELSELSDLDNPHHTHTHNTRPLPQAST